MKKPKIRIRKDNSGQYRFAVVAANGEIVCQSEAYTRSVDAKRGAETLIAVCAAIAEAAK